MTRDNFADLLRAAGALDISDPEIQASVARLLGMYATVVASAPLLQPSPETPQHEPRLLPPPIPPEPARRPSQLKPQEPLDARDDAWIASIRSTQPSLPEWFDTTEAFPPQDTFVPSVPAPIESLFRPEWIRVLIHEALCTNSPTGKIDIDRVITTLAEAKPLATWPFLKRRRLHRGVQVLVDCAESLRPYALDQRQLLGRIRDIVGPDRTRVAAFIGHPSRIVGARRLRSSPLQWPERGTPLLLLTDFGVSHAGMRSQGASSTEWQKFLERGRDAGCPIVAFTPYPHDRIPNAIKDAIAVVTWNRGTTTSHVRHQREKAGIAS